MMKCESCIALRTEGYEYPESYCLLGGEGTRTYKDGACGCYRKAASIKKQVDKIEEQMSHQYDGIDEWYVEQKIKEDAMFEAFMKEIHNYRHGNLYLCFKDNNAGKYYPISGDGMVDRELIGCLQMQYEEELIKMEREAYNEDVPNRVKKTGRREGR